MFGVSVRTVRRWAREGRVDAAKEPAEGRPGPARWKVRVPEDGVPDRRRVLGPPDERAVERARELGLEAVEVEGLGVRIFHEDELLDTVKRWADVGPWLAGWAARGRR